MKHVLLMLVSLVFAAVLPVTTYNDTLSGSESAALASEGIVLNLAVSGDLPGMSRVTLTRNGTKVTGGSFRMTVLPQNANASSNERGKLVGTITGGTIAVTGTGALSSASAVKVTIQSGGTGEFAAVTSGSATITIAANANNPSQLSGTLVLTF